MPGRVDQPSQVLDDLGGFLHSRLRPVVGLEPDRVDAIVHSTHGLLTDRQPRLPAELADLLDWIAGPVIDRGRAQFTSLVQPLGYAVDDIDLGCTFEQRAVGRQQADGARAEHRNRAPRAHRGELSGMPSGHERVGEQYEVVLEIVARVTRHRNAVGVGEGHPQQLGLRSAVGAHPGVAVSGTELPRTYPQASRGVAAGAVDADPAVQVSWDHHPITMLHQLHRRAGLFDDAKRFMPQHQARGGSGATVVHVQVGATDCAGSHAHDNVSGLLDHGIRNLVHRDRSSVSEHDSLQGVRPFSPSGHYQLRTITLMGRPTPGQRVLTSHPCLWLSYMIASQASLRLRGERPIRLPASRNPRIAASSTRRRTLAAMPLRGRGTTLFKRGYSLHSSPRGSTWVSFAQTMCWPAR